MDIAVLSLFSGVGMLDVGWKLACEFYGLRTRVVGHVEREAYAAAVLLARMEDEALGPAPIWCGDVEDFDPRPLGSVDAITAGFPCQPFSCAGKHKGTSDERWLWDHKVTLPRSATMRNGVLCERPPLELPTAENAGFVWPTATAQDSISSENQGHGNSGTTLTTAAREWPTATADSATDRKTIYAQGGTPLTVAAQYWGTPTASDHNDSQGDAARSQLKHQVWSTLWQTPNTCHGGNASRGGDRVGELLLNGQAMETTERNWPTPKAITGGANSNRENRPNTGGPDLQEQVGNWTTPQAHDAIGQASEESKAKRRAAGHGFQFLLRVQTPNGTELSPSSRTLRPRLNPAFVCWMMNFPWWWTRADPISFARVEMALYLSRQRLLLRNLLGDSRRHHEHRPQICRDFEMGGEGCLAWIGGDQ